MYGTIYVYRTNGSNQLDQHYIHFSIIDPYSGEYRPMVDYMDFCSSIQRSTVKFCRFQYNGEWYGGIQISVTASSVSYKISKVVEEVDIFARMNPMQT